MFSGNIRKLWFSIVFRGCRFCFGSGTSFVNFEHFTPCSSVSIVNFEHLIADWDWLEMG